MLQLSILAGLARHLNRLNHSMYISRRDHGPNQDEFVSVLLCREYTVLFNGRMTVGRDNVLGYTIGFECGCGTAKVYL